MCHTRAFGNAQLSEANRRSPWCDRKFRLFVLLLSLVAACQSDEAKLRQLYVERATACLPIARADSARDAQALARARIQANSATSVQEAESDVQEVRHELVELQRRMALTPAQAKHEADSATSARLRCDLAERALAKFMAGR